MASLKGVIADEVRFERGLTRATMSVQAGWERLHVRRASRVLVTSRYSAGQAQEFYGLTEAPAVVPEPSTWASGGGCWGGPPGLPSGKSWQVKKAGQEARPNLRCCSPGRLYRRKRVDVLLRAAAALRDRIPGLEVRIVGHGPCAAPLRELARLLKLEGTVTWLGDVPRATLAEEYNRAGVFCLPSVQEGFGIVLLEAMAARKPIVASRAAAIPEVAPHAELVETENAEALAAGIEGLYGSPDRREAMAAEGARWVEQFDAPLVARKFLKAAAE